MIGLHLAKFGLPRPFRSRVMYVEAQDRQTDRHRGPFYNASFHTGAKA